MCRNSDKDLKQHKFSSPDYMTQFIDKTKSIGLGVGGKEQDIKGLIYAPNGPPLKNVISVVGLATPVAF